MSADVQAAFRDEERALTFGQRLKYAVKAVSNVHRQGDQPNVFLFATARGGSTWVMEIIASQPGIKYYDEPLNIRRQNVQRTGLFPDWESVMPGTGDSNRIVRYLNGLAQGEYRFMNPPPFRPHHRWLTNRIVFKIHEIEHLIGRIARECRGQVVYLLRHPIPTTVSRRVFPRLELFLASDYYDRLIGDGPELRELKRIGATGSHLQRGTVSWCYENLIPLKHADFDGLFVTYEELALNPDRSCDLLMERLSLPDRGAMLRAFGQPSTNIAMSSVETRAMMTEADEQRRRRYLVTKWQAKVSAEDAAQVSAIMALFGLDVYTGEGLLPHPRYLHFEDTPALLDGKSSGADGE